MKTTIFSLVAFLVLGTATAFGQFSSSPMEPGLHDHLRNRKVGAVELLNDRLMLVNGVSAEWVSQDQVTLSAVVVEVNRLSEATRERIARQLLEYNVTSAVGTLTMENGSIRMVHHLNPRYVTPVQITETMKVFTAAVEEQRKSLDRSMAVVR